MTARILYSDLKREYADLFAQISIKSSWDDAATRVAKKIIDNKVRYRIIQDATGVPWFFIGAIHAMESGVRFGTHLHNGDPLTRKTVNVPAGRPLAGKAPYSWEESAIDALTMKQLQNISDWTLTRMLYEAERYNGWGYRKFHPNVLSAYLWSGTPLYRAGKYVADGKWSETAVSGQLGLAAILVRLAEIDDTIDLVVDGEDGEHLAASGPDVAQEPAAVPVSESYPKAEEHRKTEAFSKSWTITGILTAGAGYAVTAADTAVQTAMDAAASMTAWGPIKTLFATMGAEAKNIGIALGVAGIVIAISRRISAADKGKIG